MPSEQHYCPAGGGFAECTPDSPGAYQFVGSHIGVDYTCGRCGRAVVAEYPPIAELDAARSGCGCAGDNMVVDVLPKRGGTVLRTADCDECDIHAALECRPASVRPA